MKLIHPRIEILEQQPGLQGMYDMIELCGKTSYKSPVKGGKVAEDFTSARVNEGHYAVLEFGTVYLLLPCGDTNILRTTNLLRRASSYTENPYSRTCPTPEGNYAITTNLRVLVENGWTSDLQYWCEPTEYHSKRYTARIITDRGTSHELVRHRAMSFVQESTRYCNYAKDKFGNELTFIIPPWCEDMREGTFDDTMGLDWCWNATDGGETMRVNNTETQLLGVFNKAEQSYLEAISLGYTPQQARQLLPNALKTEICMCGFKDAWEHFFALRYHGTTGKPHPSMYEVAEMLKFGFEEKGITF